MDTGFSLRKKELLSQQVKMKKFIVFLISVIFLTSVEAIPELPNQFYGEVTYLNDSAPNGYKVVTKLGEDEFTTTITNGKYGIESPLLVSKDSSNSINKIDFYVNNQKILTRNYIPGEFTELNLDIPSTTVVINETTIENLNLTIGNSNDLTENFVGIKEIEFKENDVPLIRFDYDFDVHDVKVLLKNLVIKKQEETATKGSMIIRGVELPAGKTKTVYVDKLDSGINSVCIKDAEINSITEISNNCNGENEILIICDGSLNDGYACNVENNKYKITGLKNSGIIEKAPPVIEQPNNPPSGSSDGGGGGGGGGGTPETEIPAIPTKPAKEIISPIQEEVPSAEEIVEEEQPSTFSRITGAVIGTLGSKTAKYTYAIVAGVFVLGGITIQIVRIRGMRKKGKKRFPKVDFY